MSSSMGRMTSLFYYGKWKMFQTTNQIQSNHHFQQPSLHQAILYRFRSANIRPKFTLKLSFSSLKSQDFPTKNLPTSRHSDHFPEKSQHFAPLKNQAFRFSTSPPRSCWGFELLPGGRGPSEIPVGFSMDSGDFRCVIWRFVWGLLWEYEYCGFLKWVFGCF